MTKHKKPIWKQDGKPRNNKLIVLISGPLALLIVGILFYLFSGRYISTDNAYIKTNKTPISAEVSGKIIEVNVKDNSHVTKGDQLFLIDPEPFKIAVRGAEAALNKARTDIKGMRADYLEKIANLAKAEENVNYRKIEYARYKELVKNDAVSKEVADQSLLDYKGAIKDRDATKQEVESLKAKLDGNPNIAVQDHTSFKQAKADLEKAQLDLSHIEIIAPADGVVANVTIEPGQYTAVGLPLFTLVDDGATWIEANFKETDLTHLRTGQHAELEVDTYPGIKWDAKVISITPATGAEFSILPAQNSSGNWVKVVQRIMVRLELEDNKDKPQLAAGMSTYVTVDSGANRLQRMFGAGDKKGEEK